MGIFRKFISEHKISIAKIFGFKEVIDNTHNNEKKISSLFKDLRYNIRDGIKESSYDMYDNDKGNLSKFDDISSDVENLDSEINELLDTIEKYRELIFEYEYLITDIIDYENVDLYDYTNSKMEQELTTYFRLKKIKTLLKS